MQSFAVYWWQCVATSILMLSNELRTGLSVGRGSLIFQTKSCPSKTVVGKQTLFTVLFLQNGRYCTKKVIFLPVGLLN